MRSKSRPDAACSGPIVGEIGQRQHVLLGVGRRRRAARAAERLVDGDAREPRLETGGAAKLVEVVVGANVGRLDDVARFVVVANDAACESEQQPVVPPHQELEERGIAREHARDDVGVGDRGVRDRFGAGTPGTVSSIRSFMGTRCRRPQKRFPAAVGTPRSG